MNKISKLFLLVLTTFCISFLPVSASIQSPISREIAEELAVEAFKESLIDPYDVEIVSARMETIEYPLDSGNYTDAWYVAVKGKGTEKTSGELVGRTTGYTIIIDSGEIVEGVSVGASIAEISYRDVILDGVTKYYLPIMIGVVVGLIILSNRGRSVSV